MPYASHPNLLTPPDDLTTWRYMALDRLQDLVESRTIFFPSIALLAQAIDPFEGRLSAPTVADFHRDSPEVPPEETARRQANADHNLRAIDHSRSILYVSCWHLNDHESKAMWNAYTKVGKGVTIKSTIGRLKAAFAPEPTEVHIGAVSYIDHFADRTEWNNAFYRAIYKPKEYDFEHEVRCIILAVDDPRGVRAAMDAERLIEAVRLAPGSPREDHEFVDDLLRRNGFAGRLERSSLDRDPPTYARPPA